MFEEEQVSREANEERSIEVGYNPLMSGRTLIVDITMFAVLIKKCYEAIGAKKKRKAIETLLSSEAWVILYTDKNTECSVYTEKEDMDHGHEISTARALAAMDYDVLFAPSGMFSRDQKRFDIFLIRGHVILKADMKSISSKNPDTIAKRIVNGSQQANRLVIDIISDIDTRTLVDGLRSGISKQKTLVEILLFYRNRFYRVTYQEIMGKNIYKILQ